MTFLPTFQDQNFRSPVDLASCFGWLEVLDYFEATQSPDDFHGPATKMLTTAILFNQTSVVHWLFDRKMSPTTDKHLELAFHFQGSETVQTVSDMYILSLDRLVKGPKVLGPAVRFDFGDICRHLIRKEANVNCRDPNRRAHVGLASTPAFPPPPPK